MKIHFRYSRTNRLNQAALKRAGLSGNVHMVPCDGSAHSNPHIDNCSICAPKWGEVEVPIEHANLDEWNAFLYASFLYAWDSL